MRQLRRFGRSTQARALREAERTTQKEGRSRQKEEEEITSGIFMEIYIKVSFYKRPFIFPVAFYNHQKSLQSFNIYVILLN